MAHPANTIGKPRVGSLGRYPRLKGSWRRRGMMAVSAAIIGQSPAAAQDRTKDNAVTQAEDAFGFSVGRESVGIYSSNSARGFSPSAAGNVRLDGLYVDPQIGFNSAISDSSSVKVGLSAQGYPFSAPSGVVDYRLNRPGSKAATSIIVNGDSFGTAGAELDGSLPVTPTLGLGYGTTLTRVQFSDGTHQWEHSASLIGRWRPRSNVELLPFWMAIEDQDSSVGTQYVPAGRFLPPQPRQALFIGPRWAEAKVIGTNSGLIASIGLGPSWLIHAGAFRSVVDFKANFANLLVGEQPDGTGEHQIIADPRLLRRSLSGELRLRHSVTDGPRLHIFQLSLRGRDARRQFGGSDELDLGRGSFLERFEPPRPRLIFGPVSSDHVRQNTIGLAYDGRWKNVGELSISVSRSNYRKTTALSETIPIVSRSTPWLYDATLAVNLGRRIVAYAGYARGLEDSGLAPPNAANRNEPLPAILTRQADAGARIELAPGLRAVAGLFDLRRPTFGFDVGNRFLQIGTTRSRGIEFSLSGYITSTLSLLVGGVLLDPVVSAEPGIPGTIGRRPAGIPSRTLNSSLNWRVPFARGLELDVAVSQRGRTPSTTDNRVFLPTWTNVDAGAHYRFKIGNRSAAVRVRVRNLLNDQGLLYQGPGIYSINFGRYGSATLTIDT